MKPGLIFCLLPLLAINAFAHRLDEYLQATRVSVATNQIDLFIDLTPGVAVAGQLLAVIDTNHDGQISDEEWAAYAHLVLKNIRVDLDEMVLTLGLADTSFPDLANVKKGIGVIRIKATASNSPISEGNHSLTLTNSHLSAISVYLVNALAPKHPGIKITKQTRDELQKDYRLEFRVSSTPP